MSDDAFWSRTPEQLFAALGSTEHGLSTADAAQRLREHGANELDAEPAAGALRLLLRQFKSPLVLILVARRLRHSQWAGRGQYESRKTSR